MTRQCVSRSRVSYLRCTLHRKHDTLHQNGSEVWISHDLDASIVDRILRAAGVRF